MNFQDCINKLKDIQQILLKFFDGEAESLPSNINFYDNLTGDGKKDLLKNIIQLISQITANHHRTPNFYNKVEEVLSIFINDIKQTFSNDEIFEFFKNNNLSLLILLKKGIIKIDENISKYLSKYSSYFFYENINFFRGETIKFNEEEQKRFDVYDKKRTIGENDDYICGLIRNDSVKEFIQFVNQSQISLVSEIKRSPFETNPFLLEKDRTTLIEYAAFYGSIQIFNYLKMNGVNLTPSLWEYSIHSNNPELIHILEENDVEPEESTFNQCLILAYKCHHNDIANYIKNNKNCLVPIDYAIKFYNYSMFNDDVCNHMCKLVQFDYSALVKILLNDSKTNINSYDEIFLIILKLMMKF